MAKWVDQIQLPAVFLLSIDVTRYLAPELAVDGFLSLGIRDWARTNLLSSFQDDEIDLDGLRNSMRDSQDELGTPVISAIEHWHEIAFPDQGEIARRWVWMMLFIRLRNVWKNAGQSSNQPLNEEEFAWVRVLIRQRVAHSFILGDEIDRLLEGSRSEWDVMVASRYADWFDMRSQLHQTADTIAALPLWSILLRELPGGQLERLVDWAAKIAREEHLPEENIAFPTV